MGRSPCYSKEDLNRGAWTAQEDKILREYIRAYGEGKWRSIPKRAGLKRCGKSCRLRWLNYLRPDIKRGNISPDEEELIIRLHKLLGNRWSLIAGRLPGRTDNEIKNYWNTYLCRKVQDPRGGASTHKLSDQSNEKNLKKPKINPPGNASPSPTKMDVLLVRPKAVKCSQEVMTPRPNRSEHFNTEDSRASVGGDHPPNTSFGSAEHNQASDPMVDFNMLDLSFPDLLNSYFPDSSDFKYHNDNENEVQPSSEQSLEFSYQMMNDWTINNCVQPNMVLDLHSLSSFLDSEGEW